MVTRGKSSFAYDDMGRMIAAEQHDRCQLAGYLANYINALSSNPSDFAEGFGRGFPGEFDWKFGTKADDLFQVGDQWLAADQFGNFAAGYAAQHAYDGFGHMAMLAGGLAIAAQPGSNEHWSDRASRPIINAGATRARMERMNNGGMSYTRDYGAGRRPYSQPLTSTAGCNK